LLRILALLFACAVCAGCNRISSANYTRLVSHVARADGPAINVECVSRLAHSLKSISPAGGDRPGVLIALDDLRLAVFADEVRVNGDTYATLPAGGERVRIEVKRSGVEVEVDGALVAADNR